MHNINLGRGVFATESIASGTIIDICPVLVLSHEDNKHVAQSALYHYSYNWPVTEASGKIVQHQAVVFGLGSMFNHSSSDQNVAWHRDLPGEVVVYTALRDIQLGEELCISYGGNLWFRDADARPKKQETEMDMLSGISLGVEEDGDSGSGSLHCEYDESKKTLG